MRLWSLHPKYLAAVHAEAAARGHSFDRRKLGPARRQRRRPGPVEPWERA